jgi:diamine N-acetyltransferase
VQFARETDELIHGQRIALRELKRADVDEMASWPRFQEPELQWANLDLATARARDAWFERGRSNATRRRFVILDERHRIIGTVGLRNIDYRYGEGTLGIIIAADAVNQGNGTDAINTVIAYAFGQMGLRKIYLDVAENNPRGKRCYEKCGFVPFGQHRGPEGWNYLDMVLHRERYRELLALGQPEYGRTVPAQKA